MPTPAQPAAHVACAHCGDACPDEPVRFHDHAFCCQGCQAVYELLEARQLCQYYALDERPGQSMKKVELPGRFDYLDQASVQQQLLAFRSDTLARLTLHIPQMHCASCIWLLENLYRLNPAVVESRVNFPRKEISLAYRPQDTSLKAVVLLLAAVGYEPQLTLAELGPRRSGPDRTLYLRLGLAGFCFGNVMLLAFPDYLAAVGQLQAGFGQFFGWVSLLLATPVLTYSARGFFESAWQGLRRRYINLDFPISLGLLALFTVSTLQVVAGRGVGFFDSFTGLVFFMLVGKWVQQRTTDALRFDRDFTSYFPVAVTRLDEAGPQAVSVKELRIGDRIRVRSQEVVPADAILLRGAGQIDYSFVTGESVPVARVVGEMVYAGGRQTGDTVELEVVRDVSQGYLTQLWNNPAFQKSAHGQLETYANRVGRWFTLATLLLAAGAVAYWWGYRHDAAMAVRAFTSVLVIACPCALSLATPFALGTALSIFGRHRFYLKNPTVAEVLARADTLVFDKTGTLTEVRQSAVRFEGRPLTAYARELVAAVVGHSTHPLSQRLSAELGAAARAVEAFAEKPGQGVRGRVDGTEVRVGRRAYVTAGEGGGPVGTGPAEGGPPSAPTSRELEEQESRVWVAFDGHVLGCYVFENVYRAGLLEVMHELRDRYHLAVLSGDNDTERGRLRQLFGLKAELRFRQSPVDKLEYVQALRARGHVVVMVGDGLNDAGALRAADVGVALTDTLTHFSPACDAILDAASLAQLPAFLRFSRASLRAVLLTFGLSFGYNVFGLSLAVQGLFTPITSAILMPISSLSVMLVATLLVRRAAHTHQLAD